MTTQAIQTRYIGITNSRASHAIKAFSESVPRGVTVRVLTTDSQEAHDAALVAFVRAYEWYGTRARGGSTDGRGFVYVRVSDLHGIDTRGMDRGVLIVVTPYTHTQEET